MRRQGQASDSGPFRKDARPGRRVLAATRPRLKVFIFSEHAIYCDGLEKLVVSDSGVRVVGSTAEWAIAVHGTRTCRPDIILLDVHTSPMRTASLVPALLAACPSARIIMLAPQLDERVVSEVLRLGIRGILSKNVTGAVLVKSIRAVAAGQHWIDREILIRVVQVLSGNGTSHRTGSDHQPFGLTARELEVVSIVLSGGSNKQIAGACDISEKTVKRHLTHIFNKLGLSNRLELAVFALDHRLVARHTANSGQNAEAL